MSLDLNRALEQLADAYCEEAPQGAEYPYKVFSAKRISDMDGRQAYTLEINVWDQHRYYSRAESIMDDLERQLHRCNYMADKYLIRIFKGQRQPVADPDKSIKRIREQFELYVYDREE